MAYALIDETLHKWLGVAMIVMLALHHLLNWRWYQGLSKGGIAVARLGGFVPQYTIIVQIALLLYEVLLDS